MKFSKDIELVIRCVASCGDVNRGSFIRRWNSLTSGGDYSWARLDGIESFIVSLEKKLKKKIPVGELTRRGIVVKKPIKDQGGGYDYPIFITYEMLIRDSMDLLSQIPEIKGVLGCPRSGMISASTIASALAVPLYSLSEGRMVKLNSSRSENGGNRMKAFNYTGSLPILVVDDSCFSGSEMKATKALLSGSYPDEDFIYSAVFSTPLCLDKVDFYSKRLPYPHIFEWNMYDSFITQYMFFDMDGVLCEEIPYSVDQDPEAYEKYIKNVKPIRQNIPGLFGCDTICTGRLEKYRDVTKDWLNKNNVKYKRLLMFPGTKEERDIDHHEVVGKYKANEFLKSSSSDNSFFVESSDIQSRVISRILKENLSDGLVVCSKTKRIYS